ncbi:MAG: PEGA domain-containing protein [Myxococcota bacterium]|jgi:PEGA domain|nr:PEGA domain-containing protein [Myxococcota bacterium]
MTLPRRLLPLAALAALALGLAACGPNVRAAVSLKVNRDQRTPRDAGVWIDEEFIGPLSYVAAYGVRLPVGEHRITVQKAGYFPWDRLVTADREPIALDVVLEPIPD